jgi:penicillin-insensitive murein endopeptidase
MDVRPHVGAALLTVSLCALLVAPDPALGLGGRRPHSLAPSLSPARTPAQALALGKSIGSPNEGRLEHGAELRPSASLRTVPSHAGTSRRFGLPALVGMLERSADVVARKYPGSVLSMGDLSQRGGGDVTGHHSHESGRDADVGFYLSDKKGVYQPGRFYTVAQDGRVDGLPGVRFDDARNWALVASWLDDPVARVGHIFVAKHLRARLLAAAVKAGASVSLRNRAALALMQPTHALPHDNHFHVRIACPENQRGSCVEYAARVREEKHRTAKAKPVIAKARKRGGTSGHAAKPLVGVVPAEDDFSLDDGDAPSATLLDGLLSRLSAADFDAATRPWDAPRAWSSSSVTFASSSSTTMLRTARCSSKSSAGKASSSTSPTPRKRPFAACGMGRPISSWPKRR